jgi:hypothetical protein
MKAIRIILFFCLCAFTSNILKAQKYDTIMLPLKYEQYVMVVGLNQTLPRESQYISNFTFEHPVISLECNCDAVINLAKNKARKTGGNIIKITQLVEPVFPNNCCKITADILFNDSIKAIPAVPKPNQISYRLVKHKVIDTTTSFSRFTIMINPTLMLGQKEFGGMFEYRIKKNIVVEVGGGANIDYSYDWETSHAAGKKFGAGEGFTIRSGMRFYSSSGIYFNPVFFYRSMIYHNRYYEWSSRQSDPNQTEPGYMSLGCGCDGDSGAHSITGETVDENKQVFSFEALIGKELRWRRMALDIYGGFGVRNKYKQKQIIYDYYYQRYNSSSSLDHTLYYNPPIEEKIHGYLPTIHAGLQIGFLSKTKK